MPKNVASMIRPWALVVGLALCSAPAVASTPDGTARSLAGLEAEGSSGDEARQKRLASYAEDVGPKWARYWERIAEPMMAWAADALPHTVGETIFYPFSGPDLPTVAQLYPKAGRYVMVALQVGGRPPELGAMSDTKLRRFLNIFERGFSDFTRRGFFRTDDLKADTGHDKTVSGVTPVLMAFAARMGMSVEAVEPIRIAEGGAKLEPHPGDRAEAKTWDSVRLTLKAEDGRAVTVDYVHLDLSDSHLEVHGDDRAWLRVISSHKTFTKAASHLLQKSFFSVFRDILIERAPSIVQDETALDYALLRERFDVALYGDFTRAHTLWSEGVQRALKLAYDRTEDVEPLPFRFGYHKEAGSCLQVATRKAE